LASVCDAAAIAASARSSFGSVDKAMFPCKTPDLHEDFEGRVGAPPPLPTLASKVARCMRGAWHTLRKGVVRGPGFCWAKRNASSEIPKQGAHVYQEQPRNATSPKYADAVCEVGGSTPGLSHGDLGIFLGAGQTEKFVH